MTSNEELTAWLESDDPELVAAIVDDIRNHVARLRASGGHFYGYAALPGDYCTQLNPASLSVAFNRETDIDPENADSAYYRYSVDEWENYVDEGFEASNSMLGSLLEHFRSAHSRDADDFQLDEYEKAYIDKTNRAVLDAMRGLKNSGIFDADTYLIIWFSDSGDEIMDESARALNGDDVYQQWASEFQ